VLLLFGRLCRCLELISDIDNMRRLGLYLGDCLRLWRMILGILLLLIRVTRTLLVLMLLILVSKKSLRLLLWWRWLNANLAIYSRCNYWHLLCFRSLIIILTSWLRILIWWSPNVLRLDLRGICWFHMLLLIYLWRKLIHCIRSLDRLVILFLFNISFIFFPWTGWISLIIKWFILQLL
jgi:hypothetical protein